MQKLPIQKTAKQRKRENDFMPKDLQDFLTNSWNTNEERQHAAQQELVMISDGKARQDNHR